MFAAIAAAVVADLPVLVDLDDRGESASVWAVDSTWLRDVLRVVEVVFDTRGMTVATILLAGFMLLKKHRRAAVLVVAVMAATAAATYGVKVLVGRGRPEWQSPDFFLHSNAYPSGHSSSVAAFAGLVIVLAAMLIRRRGIRRLVYTLAVLVAVAVMADRVLLGRHYPSDVVGGALLGVGLVLLGVSLYSPLPRGHAVGAEPLTQPFATGRNLAVILNPIKVESVEQFQSMVAQMAAASGWNEPRWHFTTPEDSGTGQAEQAAVEGAHLVIVCGGDGTVREVCAELAGTGIPVGIVPAGTGNLLARNLEVPLFIRAAIDVALNGQDRAIDMVQVHGDGLEKTHFMVMAGLGFDAAIMEGVNEDFKKKVGWLAYVLSALKSLMFPAARVEISVDGGEWTRHRARTIVVGNVGYLQAGMPLLPDATIDDGLLDVVLLYPQRFWSWVPLAFRVLAKRARTDDTINRMTGRTVSIRAAAPTPRQLDGDTIGAGTELHMECIHGRVLVRVPR
ncbi:YegS/Rv2252/BmrU family lipid kinase [Nocardioides sp. zg-536]|uniref:YegS/Rv2252/BmrU family lipid kinase n=1 Tax=Nocardioides faecalis TaxID=2803858 RepID=A0A938Y3R2_9ACTN|nr:YegS/Rv2252/BmrU family lipid kinase [Nocardioides faecalis]MBS4753024.1 YegS/Rv2252/BmrU family lipid kinase [Nocardioides faecalis]QVI60754.1 YegS/Rv2252/BmrU family lipid kinase [Nocardioides faecalis]